MSGGVFLADRGEGVLLVADEGGRTMEAPRMAMDFSGASQQGLKPGIFQQDADGAGAGGVGAGRHVQG